MKKWGLLLLLLVLLSSQPLVNSSKISDKNGIKFTIRPYEGFNSYVEEKSFDYKIETGQQFLLYLEVENTNDQEIIFEKIQINYKQLTDKFFLGKKGTNLAIKRFYISKEFFDDRNGNLLYDNKVDYTITKKMGIPIKKEFKIAYILERAKMDRNELTLGAINFEILTSDQMKEIKEIKTKSNAEKILEVIPTIISAFITVLLAWLVFANKIKGKKAKKTALILAVLTAIITISTMLFKRQIINLLF